MRGRLGAAARSLVTLYWLAVVANLLWPLPAPYATWLSASGLLVLLAHALQAVWYVARSPRESGRGRRVLAILWYGAVHRLDGGVMPREPSRP